MANEESRSALEAGGDAVDLSLLDAADAARALPLLELVKMSEHMGTALDELLGAVVPIADIPLVYVRDCALDGFTGERRVVFDLLRGASVVFDRSVQTAACRPQRADRRQGTAPSQSRTPRTRRRVLCARPVASAPYLPCLQAPRGLRLQPMRPISGHLRRDGDRSPVGERRAERPIQQHPPAADGGLDPISS